MHLLVEKCLAIGLYRSVFFSLLVLFSFSARPGRPPKRSALATPEVLDKLKKSRMENGDFGYAANRLMGKNSYTKDIYNKMDQLWSEVATLILHLTQFVVKCTT